MLPDVQPADTPTRRERRELERAAREVNGDADADGAVIAGVILLAAGLAAIAYAAFGPIVAGGLAAVVCGLSLAGWGIVRGAELERQVRAAKARGETPDVPGRDR